jgi:hypothetical protein
MNKKHEMALMSVLNQIFCCNLTEVPLFPSTTFSLVSARPLPPSFRLSLLAHHHPPPAPSTPLAVYRPLSSLPCPLSLPSVPRPAPPRP